MLYLFNIIYTSTLFFKITTKIVQVKIFYYYSYVLFLQNGKNQNYSGLQLAIVAGAQIDPRK